MVSVVLIFAIAYQKVAEKRRDNYVFRIYHVSGFVNLCFIFCVVEKIIFGQIWKLVSEVKSC